jgi:hypothetical protein
MDTTAMGQPSTDNHYNDVFELYQQYCRFFGAWRGRKRQRFNDCIRS